MRVKRFLSVLLSMLMICSVFGGLSVSATTIDKTHTYTVVGDAPFLGAKWASVGWYLQENIYKCF